MQLRLLLLNESEKQSIIESISGTIRDYNDTSESQNRNAGVVHNFHLVEDDCNLKLYIDIGSAGVRIIKNILNDLIRFSSIVKIEVDI